MNSGNIETSEPQRLILNFTDKIKLIRNKKCITISNLSICYTWKIF